MMVTAAMAAVAIMAVTTPAGVVAGAAAGAAATASAPIVDVAPAVAAPEDVDREDTGSVADPVVMVAPEAWADMVDRAAGPVEAMAVRAEWVATVADRVAVAMAEVAVMVAAAITDILPDQSA